MKRNEKLRKRLRAGETFAEILVAILVVCLATALLAGSILAARNMSSLAKNKMTAYYEANNKLSACLDSTVTGTVTIELGGSVIPVERGGNGQIPVNVYLNETFSDPVVSYKVAGS